MEMKNTLAIRKGILVGYALLSLLASSFLLFHFFPRNRAFHEALSASLNQPVDYQGAIASLEAIVPDDCRIYWQIGLLTQYHSSLPGNGGIVDKMLGCSPNAVEWLYIIAPQQEDLALRASQQYPENTKTWFWLGDLADQNDDYSLAEEYFLRSTQEDPYNGLAWCRLGRVKEQQSKIIEARDAYWQCCLNGDPGSNGCYGAGRIAETLGNISDAIRYYRYSHYPPTLNRADELEEASR